MVPFHTHFSVKLVTDFLILYVYDAVMEHKAQAIKALFVDQTPYCKSSKYFCQLKSLKALLERPTAWQTEESCLSLT